MADNKDNKNEKKISIFGEATGFSSVRRGLTSPFRHLDRLGGNALVWIKNLFLGRETAPLPTEETDPATRFDVAMDVYGQDENGLRQLQAALKNQFFAWLIAAVGIGAWTYYVFANFPAMGWFPALACLGMVTLSAAKVVSTAFHHWQVRTRRLASFSEFASNPGTWLPFGVSRRAVSVALVAAIGAAMFYVSPALAQSAPSGAGNVIDPMDIFKKPSEHDLFFQLLEYMLGGNPNLGPLTGETEAAAMSPYKGPIAYAFGAFNWALIMFGTMLVSWHTIGGLVSTSKEGEILGRRYHQIWAPVRITVGMGFLTPVSGGFCAAQVLVIYLIVAGGNFANVVWNGWINYFDPHGTISDSAGPGHIQDLAQFHVRAQGMKIVRDLAEKELCYATIKRMNEINAAQTSVLSSKSKSYWEEAWSIIKSPFVDDSTSIIPNAAGLKMQVNSMWQNGGASPDDLMLNDVPTANSATTYTFDYGPVCGRVTFDFETYGEDIDIGDGFFSIGGGGAFEKIAVIRSDHGRKVIGKIDTVRQEYVRPWARAYAYEFFSSQSLSDAAGVESETYAFIEQIPGRTPAMPDYLEVAVEELDKALGDAPREVYEEIRGVIGRDIADGFIQHARDKGWAAAGMYYNVMARLQVVAGEALDFLPDVVEMDFDYINNTPTLQSALIGGDSNDGQTRPGIMSIFWKNYDSASRESSFDNAYDTMNAVTMTNNDDVVSGIFMSGMNGLLEHVGKLDPLRPLDDMVDLGHSTLEVGFYALGAWGILQGVSSKPKHIPTWNFIVGFADAVIAPLLYIGQFLLIGLFIMGIIHAYLLPMIPYFFFTMFVIGMLTLTVEALIAAPLWALMHMRMDGDDFVDQVQRPGYMIAFNLILRPVLAVLGLFLSYLAFGASAWLFNETYITAVVTATTGKEIELIGMFMMLAIAVYIHWQLALHSFELITQVPDRVTRWFGQGGENLSESQQANSAIAFFARNTDSKLNGFGAAFKMKGKEDSNSAGSVKPDARSNAGLNAASIKASGTFSKTRE